MAGAEGMLVDVFPFCAGLSVTDNSPFSLSGYNCGTDEFI